MRKAWRKLCQAACEDVPELFALENLAGIPGPFLRSGRGGLPVSLVIERILGPIVHLLVVLNMPFSTGLVEIIHDFVFEDADQPSPLGGPSLIVVLGLKSCQKSLLDQVLGDTCVPSPEPRPPKEIIAVQVHPLLRIG